MKLEQIGSYAFIGGVVIAVVASLVTLNPTYVTEALVVLGIIVGLINVTDKETGPFLLAAVSMVLVSSLAGTGIQAVPVVGEMLNKILVGIMTFVTPAVIIVALKQIYGIARDA
ncbi:MAG: hypothetical protein ABIF85_04430 [Nanoarchaeota archaeon]|nr:hypothetical protein [Nanoarchaeota archaeon]MBU4451173.1 hypothetical protein [Nanoarchaeota archaeon]MCG2724316.1 hypothetical protein [archaeon]